MPQIWKNAQSRSTGELSFATCFLNTAGGAVRVLTSLQEGVGRAMVAVRPASPPPTLFVASSGERPKPALAPAPPRP